MGNKTIDVAAIGELFCPEAKTPRAFTYFNLMDINTGIEYKYKVIRAKKNDIWLVSVQVENGDWVLSAGIKPRYKAVLAWGASTYKPHTIITNATVLLKKILFYVENNAWPVNMIVYELKQKEG